MKKLFVIFLSVFTLWATPSLSNPAKCANQAIDTAEKNWSQNNADDETLKRYKAKAVQLEAGTLLEAAKYDLTIEEGGSTYTCNSWSCESGEALQDCVIATPAEKKEDCITKIAEKTAKDAYIKYLKSITCGSSNTIVSGVVFNTNNRLLNRASIVNSTKNTTATTDIAGRFVINNTDIGDTLTISHIGYETKNVKVTKKDIVIKFDKENENKLTKDDVSVIGKKKGTCSRAILSALKAKSGTLIANPNLKNNDEDPAPLICDIQCEDPWKKINKETIIQINDSGSTSTQIYKCECSGDDVVLIDDKCLKKNGCSKDTNAASSEYQKQPDNIYKCVITACKDGYNHNEETNTCDDLNKQPCTHPDKNATDAEYKKIDDKNVCVITKCKTGYDPSNDGQSCKPRNVLSQKDSQRKIDELTKNAQAMRDKEQSTENKLLGAAGIGATGIGGMQIMSAMAEQSADQDAETAMRAYLATFHCNYGGGMNVAGGETDVELPGGNELVGLYSEYVNLANDLKVRKAALGLRPGIESETILDSATSGLYDDVAIGKTSGAYASLARAMADPNGADAAAWAAQKSETADKLKTGAIVAGIGAIGSLAGNLALNSGDAKKEKSSEIESKYEKLKQPFQALEETINNLTPPPVPDNTCPDDATGTYPNCICNDINNPWYNDITKKCEECPNNLVYKEVEKKCGCLNDKDYVVTRDNRCVKIDQDKCPGDNFAYYEKNQTCECINGFEKTDDGTKCECPRTTHHIEEGKEGEKCVRNANPTPENQNPNNTITINLPSDSLFEFTKSELTKEAQTALKTFTNKLNQENVSCPLTIEGYTDCSGTDKLNQELSKARAEAVKKYLTETINPSPIIDKDTTIKGHGEDYCNCGVLKGGVPKDKKNHEDYKQCVGKTANYTNNHKLRFAPCRKVVITVDPNKCENKPGAQITFKEFENVISDAQELLKNKTKK